MKKKRKEKDENKRTKDIENEWKDVAAQLSSVKREAINIEKGERLHKEEKINGKTTGSTIFSQSRYENDTF